MLHGPVQLVNRKNMLINPSAVGLAAKREFSFTDHSVGVVQKPRFKFEPVLLAVFSLRVSAVLIKLLHGLLQGQVLEQTI